MKKQFCTVFALGIVIFTALSVSACNFKFGKRTPEKMAEPVKMEVTAPESVSEVKETQKPFDIIATMDTESNAKNLVWVGTFQLIWNDLIDELIKRPVEFIGTKSDMADKLNKKAFTTEDLSESAYYKKFGLASPEMKEEVKKGIKEKFNETSDIIDKFDFTPAYNKYFLYAMLKKDFQYLHPFDKLAEGEFKGSVGNVKYFGIDGNSQSNLRSNISVLFYNNSNDFAVSIKSKGDDIIYLYRTNDNKTFDLLYTDMLEKAKTYDGDKYMTKEDRFKAPIIEFKKERSFNEICNKPIQNTDFIIMQALETVQFKMNETGVKLKSEAGMMMGCTSVAPQYRKQPRYFYYNDRYIIFLEEQGKKPYFAMKVEDAKELQ